MGVQWTKEQQEVIRLRDRNILVSAAAGSGKTAVLVERILSKITDKEHPVDIDRLLIMTFTRAAAGEMKERISAAIEKALCEDPDNEHLQRQTTLLHTAQITTIDGFCAYIIRNYFHLIGLDPGYRTADEGELKLLQGDVVKALLEEYYAKKDEKFQKFVECFATGKSDENLGNLIQKLYEMAMSNPFPQEWLSGCMDDYRIDSLEELRETEWMRMLWDAVKDELQEAKLLVQEARRICSEPDGPYLYDEALSSDLLLIRSLQELAEKRDYNGTAEILMKPSFARLSTKKAADVDEQKKQRVKDLRDEEKGILKELGQRYFQSAEKELPEVIICPYEGGSDHSRFLAQNIPALLTWHFSDYTYHSSVDTLNMSSATEMENVGITSLSAALMMADTTDSNQANAAEMLAEVQKAAMDRFEKEQQNTLNHQIYAKGNGGDYAQALEDEKVVLKAWHDWYQEALLSVEDSLLESPSQEYKELRAQYQLELELRYDQAVKFAEEMIREEPGHTDLKNVPAKEATELEDGNIEYWYCGYCGKYYADQACSEEITLADTVLKFVSEEENPPVDQNDPATVDPKDPAGSDNTPKTGDESGIMLFVLLLAASASAAVIAMRKRKE